MFPFFSNWSFSINAIVIYYIMYSNFKHPVTISIESLHGVQEPFISDKDFNMKRLHAFQM